MFSSTVFKNKSSAFKNSGRAKQLLGNAQNYYTSRDEIKYSNLGPGTYSVKPSLKGQLLISPIITNWRYRESQNATVHSQVIDDDEFSIESSRSASTAFSRPRTKNGKYNRAKMNSAPSGAFSASVVSASASHGLSGIQKPLTAEGRLESKPITQLSISKKLTPLKLKSKTQTKMEIKNEMLEIEVVRNLPGYK